MSLRPLSAQNLSRFQAQNPAQARQLLQQIAQGDTQAAQSLAQQANISAADAITAAGQLDQSGMWARPSSTRMQRMMGAGPQNVGSGGQGAGRTASHLGGFRSWGQRAPQNNPLRFADLAPDLDQLPSSSTYRTPDTLTDAQHQAGFRLNRVSCTLAGNSHFSGWWNHVHQDTGMLIVQGRAYDGHSVQVGGETFENATVVYLQKNAGYREQTHIDVMGEVGEEVRLLYIRVDDKADLDVTGPHVQARPRGRYQSIGGDSHWRDVKITIEDTPGKDAHPTSPVVDHYRSNVWNPQPAQRNELTLGGDASDEHARNRHVTPA